MKLSQLFSGENQNSAKSQIQPTPAQMIQLNRQIRSLAPGQTIIGEIVGRNGSEVLIKLAEDIIMSAHVNRNMNMEIGALMTFEVKGNGSSLTLSPLFSNVSADVNVIKALDMAGVPVNESTISMTEQLMSAGMAVNRSFLQQVYREMNHFPNVKMEDIISLHKLEMPVNEGNLIQMESYRNLSHQLMDGMNTVLSGLSDVSAELSVHDNGNSILILCNKLLELVNTSSQITPNDSHIINVAEQNRILLANAVLQVIDTIQLLPEQKEILLHQMHEFASGQLDVNTFMNGIQTLTNEVLIGRSIQFTEQITELESVRNLHHIFAKSEFRNLLLLQLKEQWMLTPKDVNEPGKVGELYRKFEGQLKQLADVLETIGQNDSSAYKAITNMKQNIDFLQQINQLYPYVQLPLKLQQKDANGELYVFTNRKNLAQKKDSVSALLHLDMENMGPVDVYIAMQNNKVNTRFYVQDDDMLEFLNKHMDILTVRLKCRGYDYSFTLTMKGNASDEIPEGGISSILKQEKGVVLSRYAFDVRT